jgi:hypothetical protein
MPPWKVRADRQKSGSKLLDLGLPKVGPAMPADLPPRRIRRMSQTLKPKTGCATQAKAHSIPPLLRRADCSGGGIVDAGRTAVEMCPRLREAEIRVANQDLQAQANNPSATHRSIRKVAHRCVTLNSTEVSSPSGSGRERPVNWMGGVKQRGREFWFAFLGFERECRRSLAKPGFATSKQRVSLSRTT